MTEKIRFNTQWVNARTNLLEFMNPHIKEDIYKEIAKNPQAWLEELNIVNSLLTGEGLCGMTGMWMPPLNEPETRDIGNNMHLYFGPNVKLNGLWVKKELGGEFKGTQHEWTQYKLGTRAQLFINGNYEDINPDELLPENFEKTAELIEHKEGYAKRPIWKFQLKRKQGQLEIYAKGSDTSFSMLTCPPYYRLTSIAGVERITSETEMNIILDLRQQGVNVPNVVGHYKSDFEQFLFLEAVQGKQPDRCLPGMRDQIIKEDAKMLTALCLKGYRKMGFEDFDDKIFDGEKLWLIDVDECRDLYFLMDPNWRSILLDTTNHCELRKFRSNQRNFFKSKLKDSLYSYRETLLPKKEDQEKYARAFFKNMGWKAPSPKEMKKLTFFPKDYMTLDSYMSMMMDT